MAGAVSGIGVCAVVTLGKRVSTAVYTWARLMKRLGARGGFSLAICACGSICRTLGAAASRKRGESRGVAGEECPHEWGHGSLEGYATVGRAGRESDQIRDRQKLQENWLAGESACPTTSSRSPRGQ